MSRTIGIVCMHNAARSPLLETLLQSLYPQYLFYSGGVGAKNGKAIPKISVDFSHLLGLPALKSFSENVLELKDLIDDSDIVFCADNLIFESLQSSYPCQKKISVADFAEPFGIKLIDPINCLADEFSYQVGKFLFCGVSAFRLLLDEPVLNPIYSIISTIRDIDVEAQKLFSSLSANDSRPLVINTNLKYADERTLINFAAPFKIRKFDYRHLLEQDCEDFLDVDMISPQHEMSAWEKFVVSSEWRDWLKTMSSKRPVILLCTPVDIIAGKKHGSFLEALMSDEVLYRP